ncbi:MAG: membrane protein insertase YidC [Puniceicoccales bacterium]|jgi:YidC/Oxa1 family membrane protein insertase|nr:membrane protein insertase YidC [Puniceicoccales bacterium]
MEKKHLILGLTSFILAFVLIFSNGILPQRPSTGNGEISTTAERSDGPSERRSAPADREADFDGDHESFNRTPGKILTLENELVVVKISEMGGGIDSIALKKYPALLQGNDPWQFDAYDRTQDALSLHLKTEDKSYDLRRVSFHAVGHLKNEIILRAHLSDDIEVERKYRLVRGENGEDSYRISQGIELINGGNSPIRGKYLAVTLGSLPPTEGDVAGNHLNFIHYGGKKVTFIPLRKFDASGGFFGLGKRERRESIGEETPIIWAAIKNQFFAAILTAKGELAGKFQTSPIVLEKDANGARENGITGTIQFPVELIPSNGSTSISMEYYVGPKEYLRLEKLGQRQDVIMQFGWFGFVSKLLLLAMKGIHKFIPNWGLAIILLTFFVKLILWPLTNAQVRSTRAMAKLQEPLKKLQEKHKNNPKKLQQETMQLFRENGVNPAAGCLPIFIQLPIFIGLYSMLQAASELRFAHFLWISDLSVADKVGMLCGYPINLLPILMALTMFLQLTLMPMTPSQTPTQKYLMRGMPLILLFFCYRFPSGLVLYWTVQNILSIAQQLIAGKCPPREKLTKSAPGRRKIDRQRARVRKGNGRR